MDNYLSKKISIISFLSIVLVVFLHSASGNTEIIKEWSLNAYMQNLISNGITRIAVPIFFLISGYLFFYNFEPCKFFFKRKFIGRFKSLVIPFVFWSVSWDLFFYILSKINYTSKLIDINFNFSFFNIINLVFINPKAYQLWFLSDLILYVIMTPLFYICIKKISYGFLIPFFILWILNINIILNSEGLLFFLFGSILAIKKENIITLTKRTLNILIYIFIPLVLLKTYFFMNDFNNIFHKISIVLGIIIIWNSYDTYYKTHNINEFIDYMSGFTFFIFITHEPILTIIKKILTLSSGQASTINLIIYFISPIITILICLSIGAFFKKYLNRFYFFITGGRT